jgi:hypothetical protein
MSRKPSVFRAALLTALLVSAPPAALHASSHSEAPSTVRDRLADDTDLYAWVAPDAPGAVTFVGNWVPLIEPTGGPNFAAFDEEVMYYINIDNVGDAGDHIRYQFRFKTTISNPATFLYNTGVVTSFDDPDLNVRQTYTLTRYNDGVPTVLLSDAPVAPNFAGPVSMPDYGGLAQSVVQTLPDGTKLFVGPRDDAFFIDLEGIFDLLALRRLPGDKGKGLDDVAGFDCMTIAMQVPFERLTRDGQAPGPANSVIGIYDSAERFATRTMGADGSVTLSGDEIQVSRLGHPLVNEVVIALRDKDKFVRTKPTGDTAFLGYVTDPEVARLLGLLYGIVSPPPPRGDLVTVFLTGIPGLNKPANPEQVPCEMLRLNMAIPPAAAPNRFGVLGGDIAGFPNGRRLTDDILDISLRAVAGGYVLTPDFNVSPNNRLGDGVDANDIPFLPHFPYVAPPHNPAGHRHHVAQKGVSAKRAGETGAAASPGERGTLSFAGRHPGREIALAYSLPRAGRVSLKIFDVRGRLVRTLLDQDAAAGDFVARWDGRDEGGALLARGVYFSRLDLSGEVTQRKVVIE